MDRLCVQSDRNRASQSAWQEFSPHRAQVMDRLWKLADKFEQPSLCVLGAGNCNDLDLRECLEKCGSVTLIDFDLKAMKDAIERQKIESLSRLKLVDMDLADIQDKSLEQESWDIVVSTCLLSQLIETTVAQAESDSVAASQIALQTSHQHIRRMTKILASGGAGILVSDFVSSDTMPDLLSANEGQLATIAKQCLVEGNFFSGTNPFPIRSQLEQEFGFRVRISTPWRWLLGKRAFLVYALEFKHD